MSIPRSIGSLTVVVRLSSFLALGFALSATAGCHTTAPQGTTCTQSKDCPAGSGVCRNGTCVAVACSAMTMCQAGEMCSSGGMCVAGTVMTMPTKCTQSTDCPPGMGVCRNMICTAVACTGASGCMAPETCTAGMCGPPAGKASPGQTLAAGGGVSTSAKHIHIGLTGQGRAVGTSASAAHKTTTGATAVLGR